MSDSRGKGTLTRAGWPRPVVGGWPIPWISPAENLSMMDPGRIVACTTGAICAVCGRDHGQGDVAYALVQIDPGGEVDVPVGSQFRAMDVAVMHPECLRLSLAVCPRLGALREQGRLYVVETTPGGGVVAFKDDSGEEDPHGLHVSTSAVSSADDWLEEVGRRARARAEAAS